MTTFIKNPDGSISVIRNGEHKHTIRKHINPYSRKGNAKGYDTYIILKDGSEFLPPYFSWYPTLKRAKESFC